MSLQMAGNIDYKRSIRGTLIERGAVTDKLVVVAIDFGTTYSGYAYSFKSDFLEDPLKIHSPTWSKGKTSGVTYQTPTCALFDPEQHFDSFGFDAVEKYNRLAEKDQHEKWFFFKRFKMLLYDNPELDVRLELKTDDKMKSMPAIEVFARSIEYLKDMFLKEFERDKDNHPIKVEPRDIHWVITVPAIWNDKAKQFMREASIQACIHTDHVSIALEPEAASLFCRYVPAQREGSEITSVQAGDKYLIMDAGGGTVDITVHEVVEDDSIKELFAANGGEWGGTMVDKKFEELLCDIVGAETMEIVVSKYKEDYLAMMSSFEIKKKTIRPDLKDDDNVTISIPLSVVTTYETVNVETKFASGGNVKDYLRNYVLFKNDKIQISVRIMKGLFADTCERIVNHIDSLFDKLAEKDIDRIIMVGGFSESPMLQDAMKNAFPDKTFIIPEEAALAVLKGAVTFGHCPTLIRSRLCKHTYGIKAMRDFQPGLDRPDRKIVRKFGDKTYFLCDNTFSIHATKGESFEFGETRGKHEYVPSQPGEKKLLVTVHRSPRRMPVYTDEANCEKVGEIEVPLQESVSGEDRPVTVEMVFGKTELEVRVVDLKSNKTINERFDCLTRESSA